MPYFNLLSLAASRFLRTEAPLAVVISGRNVDSPFRRLFGTRFRIMQAGARLLYRKANAYVAISHPVAAEAIASYRIPLERTYVVPNPALAKIHNGSSTLGSAPRHPGVQRDLTIVVPARLVAQKRPGLAIDAAAILAAEGLDVEVVFFGEGEAGEDLVRHASERGVRIDMRGWVVRWFEECPPDSVVLLPSLAEGFGNVLVEAAAAGIPSVASSRCLGAADAIVNGETGEICMGDSALDFASAVRRVAGMPIRADGWLQNFSASSSGEKLLRVLEDACASTR